MLRARPTSPDGLQTRIAELELSVLFPCDLGDAIEVVHDVEEDLEVEMDCSIDTGGDGDTDAEDIDFEPGQTDVDLRIALGLHVSEPDAESDCTRQFVRESDSTHQFVRESAPYERIEIELDRRAFIAATIEDAKTARTMTTIRRDRRR